MTRILFVDDEQRILDSLENLLRRERRHWDMVFALGARAALAELARRRFDVVVSDMRMPEIDGAALLRRVKDEHPSAARIVLSGYADSEAMAQVFPVAHQFLSKPCPTARLREVIERTRYVCTLLDDDAIRAVVCRFDNVPSTPTMYELLASAVQRPDVSIGELVEIVHRDASMSAKVLQLVNSGCFGDGRPMKSIHEAVARLGIDTLKGLVLGAQVFSTTEGTEGSTLERIQHRSLEVARLAHRFVDAALAEEAFTAALLSDIGRIILAVALPHQDREIGVAAREAGEARHVVERARLGTSHAEIGAYLTGIWGLPFSIVEAVALHHEPSRMIGNACEVLAAVHVADALVGPGGFVGIDVSFLERCGLADRLPAWRAIAEAELQTPGRPTGVS